MLSLNFVRLSLVHVGELSAHVSYLLALADSQFKLPAQVSELAMVLAMEDVF